MGLIFNLLADHTHDVLSHRRDDDRHDARDVHCVRSCEKNCPNWNQTGDLKEQNKSQVLVSKEEILFYLAQLVPSITNDLQYSH